MKKIAVLSMLALGCMLASGASSARVIVGVGIGVPVWGPGYYYPPPPPPAYYYDPPPVIVQQAAPPVYVQQTPPTNYRYYCRETKAYYPQVPTCPGNWVQVSPNNLPGDQPPPP